MLSEVSDLLQLQTMAPGSLQQVTQAVDECVLLQAGDAGLPLSQFQALLPHSLHQHSFGLKGEDSVLWGFDFKPQPQDPALSLCGRAETRTLTFSRHSLSSPSTNSR